MKTAVLIPCLNEEAQIANVVQQCKEHIPYAEIYVLDNGSADRTIERALQAGAQVIRSPRRGKGNVMRHAFSAIKADYYAMLDGDGTYPPIELRRLIELAKQQNYDLVSGSRLLKGDPSAFRRFHRAGNLLFSFMASFLFSHSIDDLMSGCKVFSSHFINSFEIMSGEFELETELTLRCLAQGFSFCELPIQYTKRFGESHSKLRSFRDGWKILSTVVRMWRDFYPLRYFSALSALGLAAWKLAPTKSSENLMALFTVAFLCVGLNLQSQLGSARLLMKLNSRRTDDESEDQKSPIEFKRAA